jgi:LPXTG-motif cell wall-anchored protein
MPRLHQGAGSRLTPCVAVVLVVLAHAAILPAATVAQSAGDDQYADPLGGGDGGTEQPTPQEPTGQDAPTSSDAPAAPVTPGGEAPSNAAPPGAEPAATLPRTGTDAALPAALGTALLGAGLVLSRRALRPSR